MESSLKCVCIYMCACVIESVGAMNQAKQKDKAMSKTVGERKERWEGKKKQEMTQDSRRDEAEKMREGDKKKDRHVKQ